jgi:peptidoglycan/xylan/chitin deacetylase (PgdA/CDA1 family)
VFSGLPRLGGGPRPAGVRIRAARRRWAPQAALAIVALLISTPLGADGGSPGHRPAELRDRALAVGAPVVAARVGGAGGGLRPVGFDAPLDAAGVMPALRYRVVGCRGPDTSAYRSGPPRYRVALGFDDGPAPDTGAFLTMLERNHAHATFFVIGRDLSSRYRETLLRELRDGDVIGDHSFSHPDLTRVRDVRAQLQDTVEAVHTLSGYSPCVFRPPYGAYDRSLVRTAASLGLATVLWDVDPRDWAMPGARAIVRSVLTQVRPGSIVISHDGGGPRGQTLAAYPKIISALRARGYGIVTVPELLGFRPIYEPCILLCDGMGVPRGRLPGNAIVERAP